MVKVKKRGELQFEEIKADVQKILADVRQNGDQAIIEYEKKFDKVEITKDQIKVSPNEIEEAYSQVNSALLDSINQIIKNISAFHEAQKRDLWYIETRTGVSVGQMMRPIQSVGIYVPGGKAIYPSTVLMTVLPAKIAGVNRIILCTPPRSDGSIDPIILVAAREAGIDDIYRIGGVQAIAAMAYGTETIPSVEKIVGPGNKYVNTAKLLVSTFVGIDLPAGPSEILIIADEKSNPAYIAIDLISQAEHDENAYCFLITTSEMLAEQVENEINRLISDQPRKSIIEKALNDNLYIILVENLKQAIELSNEIAPEHLEIQTQDAESILSQVNHAGAIFLGNYAPVPVGDYAAGSNHVLPTGGAAKLYSGLSIFTFMKFIDVVRCSRNGLKTLMPWIRSLAKVEGLNAHIQAIEMRLEK
ncbi:MAG: histidinol dehydrogenase [Candidatus Helarchaeota archaeon]